MPPPLVLSAPQDIFLSQLNTKFKAYVAGLGGGKTFIECVDLLQFNCQHPKILQGFYGPSYRIIKDVFPPTIDEAAFFFDIKTKYKIANQELELYSGSRYRGTIMCRSMDNPDTIVGYKHARCAIDEIDTLPTDKAEKAARKIRERNRLMVDGVNVTSFGTTPEGFRYMYNTFADNPKSGYSMVQASSYENQKYLPDDYIDSLRDMYTVELAEAYIMGQFVNLTSGTVYKNFDRVLNNCTTEIQPGEQLHIGMDFNVGNMSAIVFVLRDGDPHAVREHCGILDTPAMIQTLKNAYQGHAITVYPDSSGNNRKSNNASETDISQINLSGMYCLNNAANPRVKDSVAAMNAMFCNSEGVRRTKVNTINCPQTTKCLEQQSYDKNGDPDKSSNNDHLPDAFRYHITYLFPIVRPITQIGARWAR